MFSRILEQIRMIRRGLKGPSLYQQALALQAEVSSLSMEEARRLALAIISDETRFQLVRSPPDAHEKMVLEQVAPSLRELFETYASIDPLYSETKYFRAEFGPAKYREGFIKIADAFDCTELVVLAAEDFLYEIDGSEEPDARLEGMPSIYHQIVLEERLDLDP